MKRTSPSLLVVARTLPLLGALTVLGCDGSESVDELGLEELEDIDEIEERAISIRTVHGKVFYDDFRTGGRFALRLDEAGASGTQVDYTGAGHNYLGALDATVEVFEIDPVTNVALGCESEVLVGSSHVEADGSFSVLMLGDDDCALESADLDIAVVVSLRYADTERNFAVSEDVDGANDGEGDPLSVEFTNASFASPRTIGTGFNLLGTRYFQETDYDDLAKGASLFASAVDVTRKFNVEAGIERASNDPIVIEYPDSDGVNATGTVVHITAPPAGNWVNGIGVMHEFGHAMHSVTWNGESAACSTYGAGGKYGRDGVASWNITSREWPTAAFLEGFGNFVRRATLDGLPGGCSEVEFDFNADPAVPGSVGDPILSADAGQFPDANVAVNHPHDGKAYAKNITKTLCDWLDAEGDDDVNMRGAGDHFTASLHSTWRNFEEMYTLASSTDCLDVCDYIRYYVYDRKSAANVGQQTHDDYEALIADLAYENGLKCGLPTP